MKLLEVDKLSVTLTTPAGDARAVRDLSFSLDRGETLGIVGESGCGKTMAALSLIGLLPDAARASGSVRLDGQSLLALSERQWCAVRGNRVSMIFQEPMSSLNPLHTVGRQIGESLALHRNLRGRAARDECERLLDLVGIAQPRRRLGDHPHRLSGGQRQRVMIAMALANEPDVLLADEPTTALDVTIQHQVLDLIRSLTDQLGMALVLISHDLGVISNNVDRVMVMYGGAVVERAPSRTLFRSLAHPYTSGLLSALPTLGSGRRLEAIPGTVPPLHDIATGCTFYGRCAIGEAACATDVPPVVDFGGGHGVACRLVRAGDSLRPKALPQVARLERRSHESAFRRDEPTTEPDIPLLSVKQLHKHYTLARESLFRPPARVEALRGVSLEVTAGRSVGIVGESGCGKSTLARAIMALERPTHGTVQFRGQDLGALDADARRAQRRHFQMVFQDPFGSLDPRHRVARIVSEPVRLLGASGKDAQLRMAEALEAVGLRAADGARYPHEFSGGQRQRIAIARALVTRPALIVADEPVSALDVSVQAQILNLLAELAEAHDITFVLISHDFAIVEYLCDEVIVMNAGEIVEQGATASIFAAPGNAYTRELMAAVPRVPR